MLSRHLLFASLTLGVILAAAMPAAATDGWTVTVERNTVFVGDSINATIFGPLYVPLHVDVYLFDPNGTMMQYSQGPLINGSIDFTYNLTLDSIAGTWRLSASVGTNEVGSANVTVIFDEINYLQKRVSLLEKQNAEQEHRMDILASGIAGILQNMGSLIWAYVAATLSLCIVLVCTWYIDLPMFRILLDLDQPFTASLSRRARVLRWLVRNRSPIDLRGIDPTLRFAHSPPETDPLRPRLKRLASPQEGPVKKEADAQ